MGRTDKLKAMMGIPAQYVDSPKGGPVETPAASPVKRRAKLEALIAGSTPEVANGIALETPEPDYSFWGAKPNGIADLFADRPQQPMPAGEGEAVVNPAGPDQRVRQPGERSQFVKSLETGGENVISSLLGTAATVLRAGQNMPGKWYPDTPELRTKNEQNAKKLDQWAQMIYEDAQRPEMQPKPGSGPWQYIQHVTGNTLPFMATAMGAGWATGPAGAFLVGAAAEGDNAYRDAIGNGASEEDAQLERVVVGTLNGAIEQMQIGGLLKLGKTSAPVVKRIVRAARAKAWSKLAKAGGKLTGQHVLNSVNEGLEEALQETVGIGAATIHGDKIELKEDAERILGAGLGGLTSGAILGGASTLTESMKEPEPGRKTPYENEQPKPKTMDEFAAKMRKEQGLDELPVIEPGRSESEESQKKVIDELPIASPEDVKSAEAQAAPAKAKLRTEEQLPSEQPAQPEPPSAKPAQSAKSAVGAGPEFFEKEERKALQGLGYTIREIAGMNVAEGRRRIANGITKEAAEGAAPAPGQDASVAPVVAAREGTAQEPQAAKEVTPTGKQSLTVQPAVPEPAKPAEELTPQSPATTPSTPEQKGSTRVEEVQTQTEKVETQSIGPQRQTSVEGEGAAATTAAPALPETAPNVSIDDIPQDFARRAYQWNSMDPERAAEIERNDYVRTMQSRWDAFAEQATSPEQQAVLHDEFERYRQGYLKRRKDILASRSRTASVMVTGASNFPTRKNQKALDAEQKRVDEMQQWDKKALAAIWKKVRNARTGPQVEGEETKRLKGEVASLVGTLKAIENGEKGLDASLFKSSLFNKLKKSAANGNAEPVRQALDLLRETQAKYLKKPAFTDKHAIWELGETAEQAQAEAAAKPTGEETVVEYDGAQVVRNYDDDRIRIYFDNKPTDPVRVTLRSSGWKWSPTNEAWQRQNTDNAVASARTIMGRFYKEKAAEPPAPSETPTAVSDKEPWRMTREDWFQDAEAVRDAVGEKTQGGWRVGYRYDAPASTGPNVGSAILKDKPEKGDTINAMFGKATVTSVSKNTGKVRLDNQQLRDAGIEYHKASVRNALASGDLTPAEAVSLHKSSYPDIETWKEYKEALDKRIESGVKSATGEYARASGTPTEDKAVAIKPELAAAVAKRVQSAKNNQQVQKWAGDLQDFYVGYFSDLPDLFNNPANPMPEMKEAWAQATKGGRLFEEEAKSGMTAPELSEEAITGESPSPDLATSEKKTQESPQWGSSNTRVTRTEYEAILERRRKAGKLPGGRQSGGTSMLDPNEWLDMLKVGMFHIEAGARQFADWSQRVLADLGDSARDRLDDLWKAVGGNIGQTSQQEIQEQDDDVDHGEPSLTSARQEWVNRNRRKLGLDGINSESRRTWYQAMADAWMQDIPENALRIASEIISRPRALSDIETAGLLIRSVELENEHSDLMGKIGPSKDAAEVADLSARARTVEAEYETITRAIHMSGTEKGRALNAQKMTINENFSLVSVKARAKAAKGEELTAKEAKRLEELTAKLTEQSSKVEALEKELNKIKAEAMLKRLKGAARLAAMTADQKAAERQRAIDKVRKLMEAGC